VDTAISELTAAVDALRHTHERRIGAAEEKVAALSEVPPL
jgi:hypothetical protein